MRMNNSFVKYNLNKLLAENCLILLNKLEKRLLLNGFDYLVLKNFTNRLSAEN
jgi:hypothetical protein